MNDPVSDFLAREQDALAGLDDDFPVVQVAAANPVQNGVQNGVFAGSHQDSGVDLSTLDINDMSAGTTMQNGRGPSPVATGGYVLEREEPENIRKWRENQKNMIEEKDLAEQKKKEELREQAKKELIEWHAQRKARLEQRKKGNREREAKHFELGENGGDGANSWERIAKIVNDAKPNRNSAIKDTSRMKALYAQYGESSPPTASIA